MARQRSKKAAGHVQPSLPFPKPSKASPKPVRAASLPIKSLGHAKGSAPIYDKRASSSSRAGLLGNKRLAPSSLKRPSNVKGVKVQAVTQGAKQGSQTKKSKGEKKAEKKERRKVARQSNQPRKSKKLSNKDIDERKQAGQSTTNLRAAKKPKQDQQQSPAEGGQARFNSGGYRAHGVQPNYGGQATNTTQIINGVQPSYHGRTVHNTYVGGYGSHQPQPVTLIRGRIEREERGCCVLM